MEKYKYAKFYVEILSNYFLPKKCGLSLIMLIFAFLVLL